MASQDNTPILNNPAAQASLQQVQPANLAPSPAGENLRCQWVGCNEVADSAEQLYVNEEHPNPVFKADQD